MADSKFSETKTATEPIPPEGWVYCKDCNIMFPKELPDKAKEKDEKREKEGFLKTFSDGCPLCESRVMNSLVRIGQSIASEHSEHSLEPSGFPRRRIIHTSLRAKRQSSYISRTPISREE